MAEEGTETREGEATASKPSSEAKPATSAAEPEPVDLFAPLLDTIDGFVGVVRALDEQAPTPGAVHALHLRFREAELQLDAFVELLGNHLVEYAVPLRKRRQAYERTAGSPTGASSVPWVKLYREAVRLLVTYSKQHNTRYGELGELVSFVLACALLKAPQVASKMTLKTSSEMLVHGADGLHVRANSDGTITLFFLESKQSSSANHGLKKMCESVAAFRADTRTRMNELRIIVNLSNLDALEGGARDEALDYFDPYSDSGLALKRRERHVGSNVYSEPGYAEIGEPASDALDSDWHEEQFRAAHRPRVEKQQKALEKHAKANGVPLSELYVFTLAVPDVELLKRKFAEANNGHIRD